MASPASVPEPRARFASARRAKRAAALVVIVGGMGLLAFAASSGEEETAIDTPARAHATSAPDLGLPSPPKESSRAPTPARARRSVRVRAVGPEGPEAGVLVRAVVTDPAARAQRECGSTSTTDGAGLATVEVDDPAPPHVLLELARAEHGLRHALVPLPADAPEPVPAYLPAGGRLTVALQGAVRGRRVPPVTVNIFPPYGDHLALFRGASDLPSADGGLQECGAVPRAWRFPFDESGRATVLHVPDDHAVLVELDVPDDRLVESATYDGPRVESGDGEVLRVLPGTQPTYAVVLREHPAARVRVTDEEGRPIAGARVAVALRRAGTGTRVLAHGETTDEDGRAGVPLWSGPRLPAWTPEGVVLIASAPGRGARVVEGDVPRDAAWYGVEASVSLPKAPAGGFAVEGRLVFANGRAAAGVPVLLATAEPWNGHTAIDPIGATTDETGAYRIAVPEAVRPVLAHGGGALRLVVDGTRLEDQPLGALWRSLWPWLPRATIRPDALSLPASGGVVRADGEVTAPWR